MKNGKLKLSGKSIFWVIMRKSFKSIFVRVVVLALESNWLFSNRCWVLNPCKRVLLQSCKTIPPPPPPHFQLISFSIGWQSWANYACAREITTCEEVDIFCPSFSRSPSLLISGSRKHKEKIWARLVGKSINFVSSLCVSPSLRVVMYTRSCVKCSLYPIPEEN